MCSFGVSGQMVFERFGASLQTNYVIKTLLQRQDTVTRSTNQNFGIDSLLHLCEKFVFETLSPENCLQYYIELYNSHLLASGPISVSTGSYFDDEPIDLNNRVWSVLKSRFHDCVIHKKDTLNVSEDILTHLVSKGLLIHCAVEDGVKFIVDWLEKHDCEQGVDVAVRFLESLYGSTNLLLSVQTQGEIEHLHEEVKNLCKTLKAGKTKKNKLLVEISNISREIKKTSKPKSKTEKQKFTEEVLVVTTSCVTERDNVNNSRACDHSDSSVDVFIYRPKYDRWFFHTNLCKACKADFSSGIPLKGLQNNILCVAKWSAHAFLQAPKKLDIISYNIKDFVVKDISVSLENIYSTLPDDSRCCDTECFLYQNEIYLLLAVSFCRDVTNVPNKYKKTFSELTLDGTVQLESFQLKEICFYLYKIKDDGSGELVLQTPKIINGIYPKFPFFPLSDKEECNLGVSEKTGELIIVAVMHDKSHFIVANLASPQNPPRIIETFKSMYLEDTVIFEKDDRFIIITGGEIYDIENAVLQYRFGSESLEFALVEPHDGLAEMLNEGSYPCHCSITTGTQNFWLVGDGEFPNVTQLREYCEDSFECDIECHYHKPPPFSSRDDSMCCMIHLDEEVFDNCVPANKYIK